MTCRENCIHYDVCDYVSFTSTSMEKSCKDFKNKSDFVEVVRCKDCRHFVREFDIVGHCDYCGIHLDHAESGFCSYGERRTDNDL